MFFCTGLLSMFIANNKSQYAIIMLVGLALGWAGDYFLHAKDSNVYFAVGFLCFLAGHIAYIAAFIKAIPGFNPEYKAINLTEILICIGLIVIVSALAFWVIKIKFNPPVIKYAILVYAVIILTMFIKATVLGLSFKATGAENGLLATALLSGGSFLFVLSDASLAVILFGGRAKNYPLKIFNIVTYFWGQIMLASSILFINI